jgi:hypothetical protein
VIATLDLLIAASPLFVILLGVFIGWGVNQAIAGVFYLMFAGIYGTYLRKIWNSSWVIGGFLWGYVVIQEAVLVILSATRYHQKAVTWKGRLVKVPK